MSATVIGDYGIGSAAGGSSPAFDNATVGTVVAAGLSITTAYTIGAISNGLLLAFILIRRDGTGTIASSVWNTNESLSFVDRQVQGDNTLELWRLINPTTGTHDLVSTVTGGNAHRILQIVVSISGAHQTTPLGTPVKAVGTASPITVTVSSVGANDLIIDGFGDEEAGTSFNAGANQTQRALDTAQDAWLQMGVSTQPGADGGVMSWTATGLEFWAQIAVAIKPV